MALLKRELYRQVKGPEITHADRCTLVFDTDIKSLYVEREVAHLEADIGGPSITWILRIISSKAVKLPGTVSYGGCYCHESQMARGSPPLVLSLVCHCRGVI